MPTPERPSTHQKALSINLEAMAFGSFAEIGAGQEVSRWFLRVGGASGTVAKTISAYDKEVSDDLYGAGTRYVSKERLQAMLDDEWQQLLGQLQAKRGATTRFFSFVDTVSARNFSGTNECHGWVGVRFQQRPGGVPNDVILHVNLQGPSNEQQQEAVGILGVNLLYAVRHAVGSPEEFLGSLFEELGLARVEIDCMELKGPAFEKWDRRELHALLVAGEYGQAVVFPADGNLLPPTEVLYKRSVVLAPDRFDRVERLHAELIQNTLAELPVEELKESKGGLGLFCLSTFSASPEVRGATAKEIVKGVEALQKMGYGVMVFRAREIYIMSAFVSRYTKSRIHFAIGLPVLVRVLEDQYKNLAGSRLEALAHLFGQNVRVSVYPAPEEEVEKLLNAAGIKGWRWKGTNGMVQADELHASEPLDFLYQYLLGSKLILPGRPAAR
jgi:hypothetical protein